MDDLLAGGAPERFVLSGNEGDRLDYLVRHGSEVWVYSRPMGGVAMERLSRQYRQARELVQTGRVRDLRRGFIYTFILITVGDLGLFAGAVGLPGASRQQPHSTTDRWADGICSRQPGGSGAGGAR